MRLRVALLTTLMTVAFFASPARAVTLREIVELTRAGLNEEILLALIEVDSRVFPIDAETIKWLSESGVSPRVIEAVVRSGRPARREEAPIEPSPRPGPFQPPPPQVIVIEREAPSPAPVIVTVPVYVTAPVLMTRDRRVRTVESGSHPTGGFINDGANCPLTPPDREPPKPVYWGWGGKLRPDAWKPDWKPAWGK